VVCGPGSRTRAEIIPAHIYSRDDLSNKRKGRNSTALKPRQKRSGNEEVNLGLQSYKDARGGRRNPPVPIPGRSLGARVRRRRHRGASARRASAQRALAQRFGGAGAGLHAAARPLSSDRHVQVRRRVS
jgi:hypothetical protein